MIISKKLQQQIKYLCHKESNVEWSGALFYSTEGEFGKDDFKCIAEEVYLMDIGSGAYTEYDYGAEFASFLMKNPRLMTMKRGHIHSHNNMGVFFSGTDTTEIMDNSAHYDYYLSLIVNNRNQMCAKIAFRGTIIEEVKKSFIYKGFLDPKQSNSSESKTERDVIFIYDCNIQNSDPEFDVDQSFQERYNEVKTEKMRSLSTSTSFYSPQNGARIRYSPLEKERQLTVPFEEINDTTEEKPRYDWDSDGFSDSPSFGYRGNSLEEQLDKVEEEEEQQEEKEELVTDEDWKEVAFDYMRNLLNCPYSTGVSSMLAKLQAEEKTYSRKGWEWKLEEYKLNRFKQYIEQVEDPHYKHFDFFISIIHKMLEEARTHINKDIVIDLKNLVFVK